MKIDGNRIESWSENAIRLPSSLMAKSHYNYLIVYDNSMNQIGLLDSEVAEKVIETYLNLKKFFDSMMSYGSSRDDFAHKNVFENLRKRHFEVKKMIEDTVSALDRPI